MTSELLEILKTNPVFGSLNAANRDRLAGFAIAKVYRAGENVTLAGDHWPYLFLVAEGGVLAVKGSSEGRSLIVAEVGRGDLFWGLAFFEEKMANPVTLQCKPPSRLYLWPRQSLQPFLLENGGLTWELARLMVSRMLRASEVIEELAFQAVPGRLARLLLEQFPSGQQSAARHLTLDEMAARVGTTREMVCRALYRFADKKLINVTRTEFVLTDRDGLAQIADLP